MLLPKYRTTRVLYMMGPCELLMKDSHSDYQKILPSLTEVNDLRNKLANISEVPEEENKMYDDGIDECIEKMLSCQCRHSDDRWHPTRP